MKVLNFDALGDYEFALRQRRDLCEARNDIIGAALYERYADAIDIPMRHLRYRVKLAPEDAHGYSRDLLRLFSPSEIERHLPPHRQAAAYRATAALADLMERSAAGKAPVRVWWWR